MLRAIRALAESHPISIAADVHGRARGAARVSRRPRDDYVDLVVDEMIPAVAAEGHLAEWCDVFCEAGVFTPQESGRILEPGRGPG